MNQDQAMEDRSFGYALKRLRAGKKMQRRGWNGNDMWIVYQKAYPQGIAINSNTAEATKMEEGTVCRFLPYIMMKVASVRSVNESTGTDYPTFVPWLASHTDLLMEDWREVE